MLRKMWQHGKFVAMLLFFTPLLPLHNCHPQPRLGGPPTVNTDRICCHSADDVKVTWNSDTGHMESISCEYSKWSTLINACPAHISYGIKIFSVDYGLVTGEFQHCEQSPFLGPTNGVICSKPDVSAAFVAKCLPSIVASGTIQTPCDFVLLNNVFGIDPCYGYRKNMKVVFDCEGHTGVSFG